MSFNFKLMVIVASVITMTYLLIMSYSMSDTHSNTTVHVPVPTSACLVGEDGCLLEPGAGALPPPAVPTLDNNTVVVPEIKGDERELEVDITKDLNAVDAEPVMVFVFAADWLKEEHPELYGKQRCSVPCYVTDKLVEKPFCDVIVTECNGSHRNGWRIERPSRDGQYTAGMCYEGHPSDVIQYFYSYPFNITMTTSKKSTVHVTYYSSDGMQVNTTRVYDRPLSHRRPAVAWMASNCIPARDNFMLELSKYVKVDSFGKCLNNADILNDTVLKPCYFFPHYYQVARCVYSHYMFVMAFENKFETDYVSEKLTTLWQSSSLPIYLGADNVEDYIPSPRSIIKVKDFASPRLLGNYLNRLISNKTKYLDYFDWYNKPMSPTFEQAVDNGWESSFCRLCKYVDALKNKPFGDRHV